MNFYELLLLSIQDLIQVAAGNMLTMRSIKLQFLFAVLVVLVQVLLWTSTHHISCFDSSPPWRNDLTTPLLSYALESLPKTKRGQGVVYCAYSVDKGASLQQFLNEAAASATELKTNNPTVPIAIITNAKRDSVPEVL